MPLVTVLNLRREDDLARVEEAIARSLASMPELAINDWELDVIPVLRPDGFDRDIARINVDLWEHPQRTKTALQVLASRVAEAFRSAVGEERHVKVMIRPYDVATAGWVSL